jgi:hypothetical protein
MPVLNRKALEAQFPVFPPFKVLAHAEGTWYHRAELHPSMGRNENGWRTSGYIVYTHDGDWTLSVRDDKKWTELIQPHPRFDTPQEVYLWAQLSGWSVP